VGVNCQAHWTPIFATLPDSVSKANTLPKQQNNSLRTPSPTQLSAQQHFQQQLMASSASSTIDPTVQRITQEYPTLKKHLDEHGYVVVRNVISPQQAAEFAQKFWDWVEALPKDKVKHKIDRNDPATWGNLMHSLGGIIKRKHIILFFCYVVNADSN
jgi:hypothetical protein